MSGIAKELESQMAETVVPHLLTEFAPLIGTNTSVTRVSGGLVHYVYNIRTGKDSFYLKVRGNTFSTLPDLSTNPKDIAYEREAITRFSTALPDVFPRLLGYSDQHSALLLTDVNPSGVTLEQQLNDQQVTPDQARNVGATIAKVHLAFADQSTAIREDGDRAHYDNNLTYRLLRYDNDSLRRAAEELRGMPRQLILSDPSPKNIGQDAQGNITMFDLDHAHLGNPIFDVAYTVGHVVLHTANDPRRMIALTEAVAAGYHEINPSLDLGSKLFKQIVGASILYRLQNKVIPYTTPLSSEERQSLTQSAFTMID